MYSATLEPSFNARTWTDQTRGAAWIPWQSLCCPGCKMPWEGPASDLGERSTQATRLAQEYEAASKSLLVGARHIILHLISDRLLHVGTENLLIPCKLSSCQNDLCISNTSVRRAQSQYLQSKTLPSQRANLHLAPCLPSPQIDWEKRHWKWLRLRCLPQGLAVCWRAPNKS